MGKPRDVWGNLHVGFQCCPCPERVIQSSLRITQVGISVWHVPNPDSQRKAGAQCRSHCLHSLGTVRCPYQLGYRPHSKCQVARCQPEASLANSTLEQLKPQTCCVNPYYVSFHASSNMNIFSSFNSTCSIKLFGRWVWLPKWVKHLVHIIPS